MTKNRVVWNCCGQIVNFSKQIHTQWRPSAILFRKFTVLDNGKPSLDQAADQNIIPWLFHAATRRFSTRTVHIFLFLPNFKSFRSAGLVFGSAGLGQALHNLNWVTSGPNVKLNRFYFVLNQDKDTTVIVLNFRFISLVTATGLDDVSFVSLFRGADMTVDVKKREGIPYMETFFNYSIWALLCTTSAFYVSRFSLFHKYWFSSSASTSL